MTLHIPDVSEFQTSVDLSKVGPAVILRAHNGARADHTFATRLPQARAHQQVRGFYGYVKAGLDAAAQGRAFAQVVGKLQPGEFAVCDLEEGSGDQSDRAMAWMGAVDAACGGTSWLYSGEAFDLAHLQRVKGHREWIAAYRATEPTAVPHTLWQHTDHEPHPGISSACDCSVFDGTVQQLRDLIDGKRPAQAVAKPVQGPHPAWFTRNLSRDMTGHDVLVARHNMGFGTASDVYDDWFNQQVRSFQNRHHLPVTGVIDAATAKAIG